MEGRITSGGSGKTLYLTQVRYLEEELDRFQLRCDELEKQNDHHSTRYAALQREKRDKEYLKCYVSANEMKLDKLAQMEIQHQDAEKEKEALKLQHSQEVQALREQVDELNTRILMRAEEPEEDEEQLLQLKQQLSEMASLHQQLEHQKDEHEAAINHLQTEAESEKTRCLERLQDDANRRVRKATEDHLWEVRARIRVWTRRIRALQRDLQGGMTERRRARLMGKLEATRTERDQTAEHAKETASRLYHHHEELEKLKGRYLDQKEELRILKATIQQQRENSEVMRYELHALRQQNQEKTAELDQLEAELQGRRSRVRVLESEKQAAAIILRHITEDQDKRSEIQWKTERLLEILESLAPQVPDSSLRPRKTSSCGNLFAPPRANRTQVQVQVQRLPPLQTDGARPETN